MAIKRNETEEPQWQEWDYAKINKKNLFADEFWKQTVEWRVLLKHVRKTENACRLLDKYVYPSRPSFPKVISPRLLWVSMQKEATWRMSTPLAPAIGKLLSPIIGAWPR